MLRHWRVTLPCLLFAAFGIGWLIMAVNTPRQITIDGKTYKGHHIIEGHESISFTDEYGVRWTFGRQPYKITR